MKQRPQLLTINAISTRRLIPWVHHRTAITRLFKTGQIKHIVGGTAKKPIYLTTKKWLQQFIKNKKG